MSFERIMGKDHRPTNKEILDTINDTALWQGLRQYLELSYGLTSELVDYGKYGWTLRYRKSGKTLCSLFPEQGAFTALIVLGKKESEKALNMVNQFNENVRKTIVDAEQFHDGRWLWIRVSEQSDIDSIRELLRLKQKPGNVSRAG